jgi:allantoin racemase
MRILCMLPAARGVYPEAAEARRIALIRSYSTPSTEIEPGYMPEVSGFDPWGRTPETAMPSDAEGRAAEQSVRRAIQAEREGYDAFCPFGLRDIGVREARQAVKIPAVGQTEACLLFCGLLDRRFAWVTYMPGSEERNSGWAREAGMERLMAASTSIGIPNSEYPARRGDLLAEFVRCAEEARTQGAEIMGLVAMSICPTEYSAKELSDACGMPVLDALACQIAMAEWWHRTGLPPSLLRYPRA